MVWSAAPQLGDVWCVAFSPDGTRLAAGGRDRSVRVFDVQTGRELLALRGPTGTVMCVAFSPDGQRIAAGSWAKEVFIWDAGPQERGER
jgi:WD40 repeat protein